MKLEKNQRIDEKTQKRLETSEKPKNEGKRFCSAEKFK